MTCMPFLLLLDPRGEAGTSLAASGRQVGDSVETVDSNVTCGGRLCVIRRISRPWPTWTQPCRLSAGRHRAGRPVRTQPLGKGLAAPGVVAGRQQPAAG